MQYYSILKSIVVPPAEKGPDTVLQGASLPDSLAVKPDLLTEFQLLQCQPEELDSVSKLEQLEKIKL